MPRTESFVSGTTSSSPSSPAKPRLMPTTSHPRLMAERTAARMTAFRPGASPPPVERAMRIQYVVKRWWVGDVTWADASGRRVGPCGVTSAKRSARCAQQAHDLPRLRMPTELRFLEHGTAILQYLEPPARARYELHVGVGKALSDLG